MARRRPFASLTSRLVLTAVLLVVAVSLLIGAAATLAMQNRLTDQVDEQVRATAGQIGRRPLDPGNIEPDTLIAVFGPRRSSRPVASSGAVPTTTPCCPSQVLAELDGVDVGDAVSGVDLRAARRLPRPGGGARRRRGRRGPADA